MKRQRIKVQCVSNRSGYHTDIKIGEWYDAQKNRSLTNKLNNMIQIGTICISEPYMPSEYELARHSLYVMECNVRRIKYMMELGYFCKEYSEEEWQKFKKVEIMLRNQHPNTEYHTKNKT